MTNEKALKIFIEHWMIEENRAKKRQWKARLQQACQKIILNRKTMDMLDRVVSCIYGMDYVDVENLQEYDELMNYARQLADDILMREEVWGVCTCCHSGIVRFKVYGRENSDFVGECSRCFDYPLVLPDLLY